MSLLRILLDAERLIVVSYAYHRRCEMCWTLDSYLLGYPVHSSHQKDDVDTRSNGKAQSACSCEDNKVMSTHGKVGQDHTHSNRHGLHVPNIPTNRRVL